ncbi:methyltransferase domain-containing protein [Streptomyces drozdowiczii]|uniref:Protein-L-isoaspartate O-methyltransferase n=1 Tax=Streptomyces drozdowiczii TaxID=202862 RepID=A0ABY6PW43_9ACTN|nr:methyltransferase domain-containing protein [Streptomyces drozdowiczii]MCX0244046.1 methyltransferase domain-containing protein [Streptomyces drozdowiczii]UZK56123.1 methyltransferase domain-containing protein [Streptomyces drozdowiczii]
MTDPNSHTSAALRARFAAALGEGGRQSQWLAAFADVPREHFVPSFYRQDAEGRWYEVSEEDPGYLEAVYSDTALTTQLDAHGVPTSSSSEPGLMLAMLDALDAEPGHRLFELGLGTGYNAALASSLLGSDNVVSVDVDPSLVRRARRNLERGRYRPRVYAGDGAEGRPDRAPYDRVIATAALRRIPPALLAQARPGAVVVAPVGFGVARLVVSEHGEATGRFLPVPAYFMPRRGPARPPDFAGLETQAGRATSVRVADLLDRLKFPLSLALPGYRSCSWRDDEGEVTGVGLWTEDGSTATLHASGRARQIGPRRLWDAVEELSSVFPDGTPAREDFGLTVTPAGQRVWYGEADGRSWAL